jgi:hypothetical protein
VPLERLATPREDALFALFLASSESDFFVGQAIRNSDYFEETSPLRVPYLIMDCRRYAEYHGMTFELPQPDPIVQDLETCKISKDRPYVYWLP